jgi:hypothetical protein
MSLFGKILTIFNVLAAIGFFAMAGMDWQKRQAWAESVLQHKMLLDGVPLDEQEKDLEGNPRFKDLQEKSVQKLFQQAGAGGAPAKEKWTQVEELKKVKAELVARIENADAKGPKGEKQTKIERLRDILLTLATSTKEREELKKLAADEKNAEKNYETLETRFNQLFDEPTLSPAPPAPPRHTPEERREMIAHLVCATADIRRLDEDGTPAFTESKAYRRALATTGLEACSREVEAEAAALQHFTDDVRADMTRDREVFVSKYHDRLAEVEDLSEKVARLLGQLKLITDMVDKQRTLVEFRRAEVDKLEKALAAAREATREQLAIQMRMEKELFKARQEQRDNSEANTVLEQRVRTLEKGR